ncbi:protein MTSS 2 isoform X2 [Pelodiscus sinensis]|uniref:protein MTSS 2 isoform X2 n=1 Tax=Pelodiscus sinensis TaxID=13735 RepID=UPI003F6C53D9
MCVPREGGRVFTYTGSAPAAYVQGWSACVPCTYRKGGYTHPCTYRKGGYTHPCTYREGRYTRPCTYRGGGNTRPCTYRGGGYICPCTYKGGGYTRPCTYRGGGYTHPCTYRGGRYICPCTYGEAGTYVRVRTGEAGTYVRVHTGRRVHMSVYVQGRRVHTSVYVQGRRVHTSVYVQGRRVHMSVYVQGRRVHTSVYIRGGGYICPCTYRGGRYTHPCTYGEAGTYVRVRTGEAGTHAHVRTGEAGSHVRVHTGEAGTYVRVRTGEAGTHIRVHTGRRVHMSVYVQGRQVHTSVYIRGGGYICPCTYRGGRYTRPCTYRGGGFTRPCTYRGGGYICPCTYRGGGYTHPCTYGEAGTYVRVRTGEAGTHIRVHTGRRVHMSVYVQGRQVHTPMYLQGRRGCPRVLAGRLYLTLAGTLQLSALLAVVLRPRSGRGAAACLWLCNPVSCLFSVCAAARTGRRAWQKSSSSASSEASETCQSVSECSSPTSRKPRAVAHVARTEGSSRRSLSLDWSKAGPYDQPVATTLQRRKDRVEHLREAEMGSAAGGYPGVPMEDVPRPRMSPATIAAKHGEEVSPAASDLAMVLTRGLSLEHQKSSRDSLQYSSGYSTQTTTPSCSEDTIPSQGSDYDCYSVNGDVECDSQSEFDKSSTIPRNSNIAQNYRRMIQTKRPASTAGLPTGTPLPASATPGVATIRRTPSTKPSVRRTLSNAGPIPIRPPIVPVKTPTVPDSPGYAGPTRVGSEECVFYADDASPNAMDFAKASPKRLSLPNTAWGSGATEISVYPGTAGQHLSAEEEEDQQLAANRHSLVEKIGELVASAHALGEGQFPFPTSLSVPSPGEETPTPPPAASSDPPAEDMLVAIRRGVRLRRTITNDRSAPRIL